MRVSVGAMARVRAGARVGRMLKVDLFDTPPPPLPSYTSRPSHPTPNRFYPPTHTFATDLPELDEYVPLPQSGHDDDPLRLAYDPAGQRVQLEAPVDDDRLPSKHSKARWRRYEGEAMGAAWAMGVMVDGGARGDVGGWPTCRARRRCMTLSSDSTGMCP